MAKRAMIYCPTCRKVGLPQEELFLDMPENNVFRCHNGHAHGDYMKLMEMNPELIKLVTIEHPQPNDVKAEFFVDKEVLSRFRSMYPNQQNATVNSVLTLFIYGEPVLIDGIQAKKLRDMGIRNGQEILASLEVTKSLESEIEGLKSQITMLTNILAQTGRTVEV